LTVRRPWPILNIVRIGIGLGSGADAEKSAASAVRQALKGAPRPELALVFAGVRLNQRSVHSAVARILKTDRVLGCSSYGEITPAGVTRDSVAVLLLQPEGEFSIGFAETKGDPDRRETGRELGSAFAPSLSSGRLLSLIFGTVKTGYENRLLRGLEEALGPVPLFGGMGSGDYDKGMAHPAFWRNSVLLRKGPARTGARMAVLELEDSTAVGFGFDHGWRPVAPPVTLTRCDGPKVFEVDGLPIFDYYRQFLGREAGQDFFRHMVQRNGFSLLLEGDFEGRSLIKLPVECDFKAGSIALYPSEDLQGRRVQLIQASRTGLLEGARRAAKNCMDALGGRRPDLVLMVSCCTRNKILHSRMETELEAACEVFGGKTPIFGYYSGGEILPFLSRYEEIVDRSKPFAGSFYHTTTVGFLAFSFPKKPNVSMPPYAIDRTDAARLKELLAAGEEILDTTEGFLGNLSRKSYEDGERLKRQNEIIHRYTPHNVWKQVGENVARGSFELADADFNGAFMFMDVKGFTAYSETHGPADVVAALNRIFDPATRLIYERGGDVDKYIGDCIFAAFPSARAAAEAGLGLLKLFREMADCPFTVRIGINAGRAVRANVGSAGRREYTFIGDAVNLAQRLEANATPGRLLLAEAVYESAKDLFRTAERKELTVKNRRAPVVAYEVS
jgi:class 3 adenylate cyclase